MNGPIRTYQGLLAEFAIPHQARGYQPYCVRSATSIGVEVISRIGLYFEQAIGEMHGTHTGFSPGESSESQTVQTSSGSINAKESPHKVRREIDRLEARTANAAPALRGRGSADGGGVIVVDDHQSVVSVRSRRSIASASSASSELRVQVLEKKRKLAEKERKLAEKERKLAKLN